VDLNVNLICKDFRELILARKRNANIWLTLATQEQENLPEDILQVCLQMDNQLYGATTQHVTAMRNANRWTTKDPYEVKHWRNVWASETLGGVFGSRTRHFVIDTEPQYLSLEEQQYLASRVFWDVPKGTWLYAQAPAAGILPRTLTPISTEELDTDEYIDASCVGELRAQLMQQHGVPVPQVDTELQPNTKQPLKVAQTNGDRPILTAEPRGAKNHFLQKYCRLLMEF
jgi:hypothetical protein